MPEVDLSSPALRANPYPTYARLRAEAPGAVQRPAKAGKRPESVRALDAGHPQHAPGHDGHDR